MLGGCDVVSEYVVSGIANECGWRFPDAWSERPTYGLDFFVRGDCPAGIHLPRVLSFILWPFQVSNHIDDRLLGIDPGLVTATTRVCTVLLLVLPPPHLGKDGGAGQSSMARVRQASC